jgi:hypothetical protein
MLDQAIVDAQALREAALKNAEQAIIEKYAPEIKSAVESLLEESRFSVGQTVYYEGRPATVVTEIDDGQIGIREMNGNKAYLVNESDLQETESTIITEAELDEEVVNEEERFEEGIPLAATDGMNEMCGDTNESVSYGNNAPKCPSEGQELVFEFTLQDFKEDIEPMQEEAEDTLVQDVAPPEDPEAGDDLGIGDLLEEKDGDPLSEIMKLLEEFNEEEEKDEEEVLEEKVEADMGAGKHGWVTTNEGTLDYDQEMQKAKEALEEKEDEKKELEESIKTLSKSIQSIEKENKKLSTVIDELGNKLQETLLSNAKLVYSNRTLNDASLNERQKNKIVEAIGKARSVEEAKTLQETLKTTVGTNKKGPQSLSESVSRKSNLSSMISRSNKNNNNIQVDNFAEKMKRLAGIK